ncbi:APC family permease [Roseateles cellulosilyticus]|uniref:APC family permease n=1 Tax=Pelomonas cellulosilytica TaxID=2906762 RepID=A0ABS8XQI3_9BURK|nr:APC family permease [Pelomonas sp. P8]MCE4555004.1 APC family permease [Pelomonas sp. P8]
MTIPAHPDGHQLRKNSLGLISVTFMVISAAAPLTGVAGAVPIAFLLGNGVGVPATFVFMTLVMLAFSAGYVAMSRHVRNAGAFYAYAARGLGGLWGGASAFIALVAYNALQFGLIGLLGGVATGVFAGLGLQQPWWVWSLGAVLLVGVLGYRQVDLSAKVLVVLVALEYLIVLIVDFAILRAGGAQGLDLHVFDPSAVFSGSLAASVLFCLGSFMGIEATTIYAEEARDPERTVPRATYLSVLLIGTFFVFTTWLMISGVGVSQLIPSLKALSDPTTFFFELAARYVGGPVPTIAGVLLFSSLFAALSAFHNYIARYSYVAGREGLLPRNCGHTHGRFGSPHVGSVIQTVGAVCAIALFAGLGLDPVLNMFTWISQVGVLGVLVMMAITSAAVVMFFRKNGGGPTITTLVLPILSGVVMASLAVYVFLHFGDLTGTQGGLLGKALPSLIPCAGLTGWIVAARLRAGRPAVFATMGANRV